MGKQLFIVTVLFIYCKQSYTQLEKGNFYPGLSSENRFYPYGNAYGFKPELSFALDKHNSVGIKFNYFRSNNYNVPFPSNIDGYNLQHGIGVTYNYFRYFKNSKRIGWYANANFDLNRIKYFDIKNTGEAELASRHNQTELSIRPGLFYKPSRNIIVFANVGGISLINSAGNVYVPVNFGKQVNVGALIDLDIFRKKK